MTTPPASPAPCRRTNAHTPHGGCPGTAPEYPSERVEHVAGLPSYVPPGGDRCGTDDSTFICNAAPGHSGDHAAYGPDGEPLCHTWPQARQPDAAAARLDRIRALTPEQCRRALIYMDGYAPQGVDSALAAVAPLMCPEGCGDADADDEAADVPAYTAELDGTENFGRANPAGES